MSDSLMQSLVLSQKHLIPQLLEEHGLTERHLKFPQAILHHITRGYTREVILHCTWQVCLPVMTGLRLATQENCDV